MQIDWANAVIDMAISEPKPAKVQNNLVPSVQYYTLALQQPAVSAVCFDTFCDKYIFYDKMAGGQFWKKYLHSIFAVLPIT